MKREQWLLRGAKHLTPLFEERVGRIPPPVKIVCAWPGWDRLPVDTIGHCWNRKQGVNRIYISPHIKAPVIALEILTHELCHAINDCRHGHGAPFVRIARGVGLIGQPTVAYAGAELRRELERIANRIGAFQ